MNSLVKVFSNFKDFYNEINGATLTGAIDVIVVEQPNGEYHCSPFHVRFGKLGVLRSREKVVDIEINGEPVDIRMKLGDSGEAFFVEECPEDYSEELLENLATSPIPSNYFPSKYTNAEEPIEGKTKNANEDIQMPLPLPRRNSIDFSKETEKEDNEPKFVNQISDFSHRRHTDNTLERRNLSEKIQEYTTQKLRQEWAEHEEIFNFDAVEKEKEWVNSTQTSDKIQQNNNLDNKPIREENIKEQSNMTTITDKNDQCCTKDEIKGKKKRRRKSQLKKKNSQRKSSSSSSLGSTTTAETNVGANQNLEEGDGISLSNNTNSSSNDDVKTCEEQSPAIVTLTNKVEILSSISDTCLTTPITPTSRIPDLDIHFFSDTEVTSSGGNGVGNSRGIGRPTTPVQSDSELEISLREKDTDTDLITNSASWKWGELPTPEHSENQAGSSGLASAQSQAQRNSMLSGMFNFMKKTSKIRKQGPDGGVYLSDLDAEGMDPEMAALYFPSTPPIKPIGTSLVEEMKIGDDDRESGNGTSLPQSPSSLEGQKSIDSDYEDGKPQDKKYLDFVAMSLCGVGDKGNPSDEEFDRHLIKYSDVCENPSLFSSPNLIVRLNGKYYTWMAACPIVMTIITFQKPLTNDAIEQLISNAKPDIGIIKNEPDGDLPTDPGAQTKRSWWNWRRPQNGASNTGADSVKISKTEEKSDFRDADQTAVATQTTRPNTPDMSENTLSKTDSTLNAENTSAMLENLEDFSQTSSKEEGSDGKMHAKNERFIKSLRLSSDVIKKLNLKEGMNEIEFSVTTAYQGTTRCKCCLFRWKHNDKVVISDIDGTITKSDVLGHILPTFGNNWVQLGVAQLFSKIEQNGYKLLYLSARAIGQSRATRDYLRSIRQGDVNLPDGPLLLNPTSLISAFHREVIERKPEQFKIACLSDIRDLFPSKDPFYAGYGNRINDVWAYRAVGIPIKRIFTINTKGELKHELTQTFQSSYCSMTFIVDQLFPPIRDDEGSVEFSNFNYWRDPIPNLELDLEKENVKTGAAPSNSSVTELNTNLQKALTTIPEI